MAAGTTLDVEDETTRINYSLGYQIGGDFDRQGVTLDADAVIAGIEDARSGSEPRMSPGEMRRTLAELKRRIVTEQRSRSANAELERLDAGRRFLEQNDLGVFHEVIGRQAGSGSVRIRAGFRPSLLMLLQRPLSAGDHGKPPYLAG